MEEFSDKVTITIDPDTLEYKVHIHCVNLTHLRQVCEDIASRIKSGQLEIKKTKELNILDYLF